MAVLTACVYVWVSDFGVTVVSCHVSAGIKGVCHHRPPGGLYCLTCVLSLILPLEIRWQSLRFLGISPPYWSDFLQINIKINFHELMLF